MEDGQIVKSAFESIRMDDRLMGDVNFFLEALYGPEDEAAYFAREAKIMTRAVVLHVLTAESPVYENRRTLEAVAETIENAQKGVDGEDSRLFNEMTRVRHMVSGSQAQWVQASVDLAAHHALQLHPKVRDDVFTAVLAAVEPILKKKPLQGGNSNA